MAAVRTPGARARTAAAIPGMQLLEIVPDGVIVLGEGNLVEFVNGAAEELLGRRRDDIVGRPCPEVIRIINQQGRNVCEQSPVGRRFPVSRGVPEFECELVRAGGRFVPVVLRCAFDKDERHVVRRVLCLVRDVSARRRMDMRTVELISTVSHEIRSPLTSIKGFTKTLLDRWDRFPDALKQEMLQESNQSADRVVRLLDELLVVSRLEAGRLRLNPARLNITDLAAKVVDKYRDRSEVHELVTQFPGELPMVVADPDKIEQVLTNLVENALKYTEGGAVRVSAAAFEDVVRVSVADSGEGIPDVDLDRLFRKFYRRERAGSPSGTGLGLYISRALVQAHGGDLSATSTPGLGTTFTFSLPIRRPEP